MNKYTRTNKKASEELLKEFKVTAEQARQVLTAIETVKEGTVEDIVKEADKAFSSKSSQGNKMVVKFYIPRFVKAGLISSEKIVIEKPKKEKIAKDKTPSTPAVKKEVKTKTPVAAKK